ncbi:MAG: pseudoazurin [Pseudomonadota bacterium]
MRTLIKALLITLALASQAFAENHQVLMLNAASNNSDHPNVFEPALLFIEPGDTVTFIATDPGHNSASWRGMLPEGAESWNGAIDEELTIEFTIPGIYGYVCSPHYTMGMVGLIVVGGDTSNLEDARRARHQGDARGAFRDLFEQLGAATGAESQ